MDYFFALNIYLRRIFTTNVMFSIAIILKRLTIKDVPMIIHELLNIKACSFHVLEWGLHTQSLVASCKYWVAPLISTRVSDYSQVILLKIGIFYVSLCTYFGLHFRKPVFFFSLQHLCRAMSFPIAAHLVFDLSPYRSFIFRSQSYFASIYSAKLNGMNERIILLNFSPLYSIVS